MSDALLKYETLDVDDVRAIVDGNPKEVHERLSNYKKVIKTKEDDDGGAAGSKSPRKQQSNGINDSGVLVQ